MLVTPHEFEERIASVARRVKDPRAGLYGPASVSWRVYREASVMLGGGRATLLQLAHPYVAYGVDQHSATRRDPVGRFRRTFENVFAMVFGDLDAAIACARRVYAMHTKVLGEISEHAGHFPAGHRYQANDTDALFWVQATLIDTSVQIHELLVGPLQPEEKERFYEEAHLFGALFGIPDDAMPESWPAFQRYMDAMLAGDVLAASRPAKEMARFLFRPPRPIAGPAVGWYKMLTTSLLPPRMRAEFDLPYGKLEEAIAERTTSLLRAMRKGTPRRLRYFPDYVEAIRRVNGRSPTDRVGRLLEKVALAALEPSFANRERVAFRRRATI